SEGAGPCTYVLRTGSHRGEMCGLPHTAQRCFGRLTDASCAQFPDTVELPRWHDLIRQNVAIIDLDFDAILAAMNALTDSAEGDCYLSVPPDPGIEAAGAGESALSGTARTEAVHTFTLDSGASRSFFRDSTTLTPLSRPVTVSLVEPSGGPVLAHSSTVLPCPAAPSDLLSGLHLPSFSTNLVSGADLQDVWVDQFAPGGQRLTHCTCSRTGHHLATFTRRPWSSLYTLTTTSPLVSASSQVAASSQVFAAASRSSPASAPCSCRPLSHETLLWHHRLGHPSLPRLRGMASRTLVSGLPRSLPPLPLGPAPTCVPCVEGWQRAAPHSSFPPTEAPLQTLHMDVWGPARVRGQGHERYFELVVNDYSRYTTVFPLRSKDEVPEVLIDWIRSTRCQLGEHFGSDLPVLRLHSDRGGEFSSDLLRAFCRAEGIRQTFMLPASPQQNGIAERRIGMVMDDARTSMIHAAAPHFLWPFAVQYAAHQINLQPRVSLPKTTPTLSSTTPPRVVFCPLRTSRLTSRCLTTVSFPSALPLSPPLPLFLAPGTPPVDPLPPQGPAPSGVSQVDPAEPVKVAVDSGAARGAGPAGVGRRGAEPGGAEPERVEPGGSPGVPLRLGPLSSQRLREWYAQRCGRATGAARGAAGAGSTGGATGAGAAGGAASAGAAGGATGAGAAGGAARTRVPLGSTALAPPGPVPPAPVPPTPAPPALAPPAPEPPAPAALDSVGTSAPAPPTPLVPAALVLEVVEPPGTPAPTVTLTPPPPAAPAPPTPVAPLRRRARQTSHSRNCCRDSLGEAPAEPPDKAAP
ncbi:unnamed protein product, partial [Closterium sp. NIES-54]